MIAYSFHLKLQLSALKAKPQQLKLLLKADVESSLQPKNLKDEEPRDIYPNSSCMNLPQDSCFSYVQK